MKDIFRIFANKVSEMVGSPWAFIIAVVSLIIWGVSGPIFHYSDTWQLIINTSTTIITFLMVFLIQNTQNRDSRAINLKLDELIHGNKKARNKMINLEELSDEEIERMAKTIEQTKKRKRTRK